MKNTESTAGMVLRYPATRWQDALPTGSGVVGAMLYGNVVADEVLLNHGGLYYPFGVPATADVSDQLPRIRQLIEAGDCRGAAQLLPTAYAERTGTEPGSTSAGRDPYQPFCTIALGTHTDGPFRKYRRGVDFATGRVWVTWSDAAATFTREAFVCRLTDTVYLRIRSDTPGTVNCTLGLTKTRSEQVAANTVAASKLDQINMDSSQQASVDHRSISFAGRYPNGFAFGAIGQVTLAGGALSSNDDALVIKGADEVVLRVRLGLSEVPDTSVFAGSADDGQTYDQVFSEHVAIHGELFERMTLSLGKLPDQATHESTDDMGQGEFNQPGDGMACNERLLMQAFDGDVPDVLTQRMFEFGRYLLICSSRPGGLPANLQGIWNGDYAPAWNSDIHTDENIQMNYWQALPGGLTEAALPLFDYFEKHLPDFRENAKNVLGCRGIFIPIAMTTHGREIPSTWSNWTAAAGWIAQHFYDYYQFTLDRTFLAERAVPWLKQVAAFYEDFLMEGEHGQLVFNPSLSPENRPAGGNSLLCINATMDVAICREVLTNLCEGCELLGIESAGVARWRAMLKKLPAYEINEDGAMKEWLHPNFKDNYHHRHQSHIYPVFPGLEVTAESDHAIFEACRVAVEKRLVIGLTSQTGWSMAHMANIYARLGEGDRALECLELITRSSTGPNLLTYHNDWRRMGLSLSGWGEPPFQIDAIFGFTAAVLEMLVFSKPGLIKLLPALPERWSRGEAAGVACRGGLTVDMRWDVEQGRFRASLVSTRDHRVRIVLPKFVDGDALRVVDTNGQAVDASVADGSVEVALTGGSKLELVA